MTTAIERLVEGNNIGERDIVLLNRKDMETLSSCSSTNNIKIVNIKKESMKSEQDVFECFSTSMNVDFGRYWDGLFHMLRNFHEDDVKFVIVNIVSVPMIIDSSNEELDEMVVMSTFFKLLLDAKEERDDEESVQYIITAPKEEELLVRELCKYYEVTIYDPMPLQ